MEWKPGLLPPVVAPRPILETFLVEWKRWPYCGPVILVGPLETFLVEWKPIVETFAKMRELSLKPS